jgi:cytochrome c oxidase subunit II
MTTSDRSTYSGLESLYLPIAIAVVVIFLLVVLFAAFRYRRRSDELPSQKDESKAEYVYIGLLVLVAAFLVAATYRVENKTDNVAAAHDRLRVDVTGARWNWRFTYPDYGITVRAPQLPTLVVPTGTQVAFSGTSQDVIHSFWVPDMRFKHDVFPGAVSHWALTFTKPQYAISGTCAEYCGLLHADMRFFVNAVTPDQFRAWVRRQQAKRQRAGA